jgi:cyclopropane fatty-acyl-phospholipid synthase-like methyltransferase
MRRWISAAALALCLGAGGAAQETSRPPAEVAARAETPATAAYRYRAAIAGLLLLKPGMVAAEVGPGSGYVARAMASQVLPGGRVIAATLDQPMAAYIADRAKAEHLENLSTVVVQPNGGGLEPASLDAVAIVNAFGDFTQKSEVLQSVSAALKPGGALLIVDLPAESVGPKVVGIDADEVVKLATAAGLTREAESTVVPGQYAIRFRKPAS